MYLSKKNVFQAIFFIKEYIIYNIHNSTSLSREENTNQKDMFIPYIPNHNKKKHLVI